jgi:AraC-like DNA-binding protein
VFVREGCAEFKIRDKTYLVKENSLVFISNLETHKVFVKNFPYKRYYILIDPLYFQKEFNDPIIQSIFKQRPGGFDHCVALDEETSTDLERYFDLIYHEYSKKSDYYEEAMIAGLMLFMIMLYRKRKSVFPMVDTGKSSKMIFEIQKYIENNYTEDISLEKLSKIFFTNMYYLSHLFKKYSGYNYKRYLILQRISKAKESLLFTEEDISGVAHSCGYSNVNHFIRIFRQSEGTTPYRYKKNYRSRE